MVTALSPFSLTPEYAVHVTPRSSQDQALSNRNRLQDRIDQVAGCTIGSLNPISAHYYLGRVLSLYFPY
jgi:hypothetical protein